MNESESKKNPVSGEKKGSSFSVPVNEARGSNILASAISQAIAGSNVKNMTPSKFDMDSLATAISDFLEADPKVIKAINKQNTSGRIALSPEVQDAVDLLDNQLAKALDKFAQTMIEIANS
jgi:hypothetical protein